MGMQGHYSADGPSGKDIEESAIALGMQRRQASQTRWVSISNGDIFEISSEKKGADPGMPDILSFFGR